MDIEANALRYQCEQLQGRERPKGLTMKLKLILPVALVLSGSGIALPAIAQNIGVATPPPVQTQAQARAKMREVIIYGSEPCPKAVGDEIVVCRKGDAQKQFRIPKQIRDAEKTQGDDTWAAQQQALGGVGAVGIGSCSTVGSGGGSGCATKAFRNAKAERKQIKAEQAAEDAAIRP